MLTKVNTLYKKLEQEFGDRISIVLYNIFYDDTSEISDLMERVHWDGIKLPAIFIGDKLVLSGYIDTGAVREILVRMGIK